MPVTEAKTIASTILAELGQDFVIPEVILTDAEFSLPEQVGNPLYAEITRLTLGELTDGKVDGTGAFDKLMSSHKAHLKDQHTKGLITGDQYTKAYIELTSVAMSTALQFLLQKEQLHWGAVNAQAMARRAEIEAVTAAVQLELAKVQLVTAQQQSGLLEAQYALTIMQLANEDAKYALAYKQIDLVNEQIESQRGQTLDTRSDGITPIAGMLGKQKDLYTQQIDSYRKDSIQKVGKMYLDGWITQKTLDEGLAPPTELTNNEINEVLQMLRTEHGLNTP